MIKCAANREATQNISDANQKKKYRQRNKKQKLQYKNSHYNRIAPILQGALVAEQLNGDARVD